MECNKPSRVSHDHRVSYLKRKDDRKGVIFMSHNGERLMLPDGWLSFVELTDEERLLTVHSSVDKIRVRGHKLDALLEEVSEGSPSEVHECSSPTPAEGLWLTDLAAPDRAAGGYVPAHLRE